MKAFRIARFSFELEALDEIFLPPYKGSTLRGGSGHSFKKTVCALKSQDCDSCLLRKKCVYSYVFENPPPSDKAKFPGTVPSMFLIMYLQAHHLDLEFYDQFFKPGAYLNSSPTSPQEWMNTYFPASRTTPYIRLSTG